MARFGIPRRGVALVAVTAVLLPAAAHADQPVPAAVDAALPSDTQPLPRVTEVGVSPAPPIHWVIAAAPTAPGPGLTAAAATPGPVSSTPEPATGELTVTADDAAIDTVGSETIEIFDTAPAGAHAELDQATLERSEHDDIHKVLAVVAGVYLRDEDGYGLRPNIGMRGAAAERSAKIALMEDGVLIAPAPYSAPAAYYFPLTTRMSKVEVVKGPSAIVYGPNTVGGAINLVGAPLPGDRTAYLDVALGSDLYGKVHGRVSEGGERWGVMVEAIKLRTDGFKELDGGGDTGFDKNDVQLSARVSSAPSARVYHRLEARVGYANESSNETYTGLSDADFRRAPQRRYVATQNDHMEWDHWRFRLAHTVELGTRFKVETTAYRHQFDRAWAKVDAFVDQRDLAALLAEPTAGSNAIYYPVLIGDADSSSPGEELIRGTNDREFVSQGIQSRGRIEARTGPIEHLVDVGVRVHYDRADRVRYEDAFRMMSRVLVRSTRPQTLALDSTAEALAVAFHAQDEVSWKRLKVAAGARIEVVDLGFEDHRAPDVDPVDDSYNVVIPGGGAQYQVTDHLSILAGVHRGFVPVAPTEATNGQPELSVNYEAGGRWRSGRLQADVIGFFSNYSNLKGLCSFSTGCRAEQEGDAFDGGRVHIYGLEAQAAADVDLPAGLRAPLQAAYTLTQSEFQTGFTADFAGWGDVFAGDELPYLPEHQVVLSAAVASPRWEIGTVAKWRGAMRDQAGHGELVDATSVPSLLTIDMSAHVLLGPWGEVYSTCSNALDEQVIVSRRPYGARPNSPRLFVVGYKARF